MQVHMRDLPVERRGPRIEDIQMQRSASGSGGTVEPPGYVNGLIVGIAQADGQFADFGALFSVGFKNGNTINRHREYEFIHVILLGITTVEEASDIMSILRQGSGAKAVCHVVTPLVTRT